jgi:hypothetical protein
MLVFLATYLLTVAVEFIFYKLITQKKAYELLISAFLINLTQPFANFSYNFLIKNIYFIEVSVIVVEIFLVKWVLGVSYKKAVFVSFCANLATALLSYFFH